MQEFKKGKKIKLENGEEITIINKLGEGGQGVVYKVAYRDKEYALKWYFPKSLTDPDKFYRNLAKNANMGSPAKEFLWPLAVTSNKDGRFGYIMDLRRQEYKNFAHFLNATVRFQSTTAVINAALNMVNAFQALHRKGYSYQDLNDGNFFVNPANGDLLICDNDNVAPYGQSLGVGGKSRYMAPEVVLGTSKPNYGTDLYSLSVVLFMMFFFSHPLEGALVAGCPCLTDENEKKYYASNPIFICDPNDSNNRPVRGIHNNVIKLWPLFPRYFQNAFIHSFTEGAKGENKRLSENEWKKELIKLADEIVCCPKCGEENFASLEQGGTMVCCECKNSVNTPLSLCSNMFTLSLCPDKRITKWHTEEGGDWFAMAGIVVQNKSNPNLWGIRNASEKLWVAKFPNGEEKTITQHQVVPILKDVSIDFGTITAIIK